MRWLADIIYFLVGLLYLPVVIYNALIVGKNRRGWSQRFGEVPQLDPDQQRIWIHAVSLGEINATPKLVQLLQDRLPETDIVFSSTTDTGYARAVELYGSEKVFRFPLDFSPVISRTLNRIKPSMIILVELEVWYNLLCMSTRRNIPIIVINGRLTLRSAERFKLLGPIARSMFQKLNWVGAQDESIASRFIDLGVPAECVEVTSSLKWDTAEVTDHVEGADRLAHAMSLENIKNIWVCGSTGPNEEALLLTAYHRLLDMKRDDPPTLVIVPRKPERFDEVARIIESGGFICKRRSEYPDDPSQPANYKTDSTRASSKPVVILGDTMGELRKFYSLADVVFVGRSLVPMGGSDPIEAAALGKPVIIGFYSDNFQMPVKAMQKAKAIHVVESELQLASAVQDFLKDSSNAKDSGSRARQVVIENQGATQQTVEKIIQSLEAAANPPSKP